MSNKLNSFHTHILKRFLKPTGIQKSKLGKSSGIALLALLVFMLSLSMVVAAPWNPGGPAHPFLTPKWAGYVAGGGESVVTADVRSEFGGEEVFHVGGPVQPNSVTPGRVTCLNGRDGYQIWNTTIFGIGDTSTLQMGDIDLDGKLEIITCLQHPAGVYILNAEDGSILWRPDGTYNGNPGYIETVSGRIDGSGVIGDTDGDGYLDIFIGVMAYELYPNTGKIVHYEWDAGLGTIIERGRVQVWHPCAGGLSLGDTDNDGVFELYTNERDVYFGDGSWGRGITSFWADNLTKRWSVYYWGASSNIPMLADVNEDGVVDVVSTNLGSGIAVLNSSDGHPLENGDNTILLDESLGVVHAHYQSSVFDIDGDGNLELLCADGMEGGHTGTQVWDLWDWELDADIGEGYSFRGPSVGEITGDGFMDIIVVTFEPSQADNGTVQIYNQFYQLMDSFSGLKHRAIGSVVQDIDRNDGGLNELLVLTQGGIIYCFDTPGLSQENLGKPRARSEIHFYSESRLGVSEYVPYERPWSDVIAPSPSTSSVNVSTEITSLSFTLKHPLGQLMDYVVTCDPNIISGGSSSDNVGPGQKNVTVTGLAEATTYHWEVDVTDESGRVTTKDYWFTTEPYVANSTPTQIQPTIVGNTELVDITASNQSTSDVDGDSVINIYNWLRNGDSITNLNLPFAAQTQHSAEYSGTARTRDYSGYNHVASVVGATWTNEGIVGGAYEFDGNDFIRVEELGSANGSSLDGAGSWGEMSLELWVRATTTTSNERLIWKHDRYTTSIRSYRLDYHNTGSQQEFTWYIYAGDQTYNLGPYTLSSEISDWHHLVATYKSGVGLRLYIDGELVANKLSALITGNIEDTNGPLEIAFNGGSDFSGIVDEVRLYPYEISPFMVNQRYMETRDGLSNNSTIPAEETNVGDEWKCQVTPNDGLADGSAMDTAPVIIINSGNNVPVASNLTLTPSSPLTTDNLVANYTYNDLEGQPEHGSIISWYKNGLFVVTNPVLPADYTGKGESWYFTVRPSDGFDYGVIVISNPVVIGNTAPSFTNIAVSPDPAFDDESLAASTSGWIDIDGDSEGYIYQWQKLVTGNWQNITGAISQTLSPSNFVAGDELRVSATAWDGVNRGNSITSPETAILNSSNTLRILWFSPEDATPTTQENQTIDFMITVSNPHNNPLTYVWKLDSVAQAPTQNWTSPALTAGTHTVQITVSNGTFSDYQEWNVNVIKQYTLSIQVNGSGVTNPTGESLYDENASVSVLATEDSGWMFSNWLLDGNDAGSDNPHSVTMDDDHNLTAVFIEAPVQYTLSVQVSGLGVTNATGTAQYNVSTNVNVLATANSGWVLSHWLLDDVTVGSANPYTVTIDHDYNLTAVFTEIIKYDLHVQVSGLGTTNATGDTSYNESSTIGVQATPNSGWTLSHWLLDNVNIGSANPIAVTMNKDYNLTAVFTQIIIQHTLTVQVSGNGATNATGDNMYDENVSINVLATADSDWTLSKWLLDGVDVGSANPYEVTMNSEHNLTAVFTQIPTQYALNVQVTGNGATNVTGTVSYDVGASVKVLATPSSSWVFSHWLLGSTNAGSANPYTVTMNNNQSLTAVFMQAEQPFPWTIALLGGVAAIALISGIIVMLRRK